MSSFRSDRARKPYSRPASRSDAGGQWLHDKAPTAPKADLAGLGKMRLPVAAATTSPNTKLVVSNLHYEITPKDLTAIFGQIGTLVREPLIRYDRSGRSSGTAIVSFETHQEAIRAKKQFDGILARGQPMSIAFDTFPPRNPRRAVSAPTTASLLNRIQKPPLLDRLSRDDFQIKAPSGPRGGVGPIRNRTARPAGPKVKQTGPRPGPKTPKTAEELDKELDAFMVDSEATDSVNVVAHAAPATAAANQAQDVEME